MVLDSLCANQYTYLRGGREEGEMALTGVLKNGRGRRSRV